MNVVAVASLLGLSGVIIAGGVEPDEDTIQKAKDEDVPLFMTDWTAFEVVGMLYGMGVR
jgi:predicted transcriptional regulator